MDEDVAVLEVPGVARAKPAQPGGESTDEELIAYCRERLARYKCPTSVDRIDALPRNPSGKILKTKLREPYWAGRARRVN